MSSVLHFPPLSKHQSADQKENGGRRPARKRCMTAIPLALVDQNLPVVNPPMELKLAFRVKMPRKTKVIPEGKPDLKQAKTRDFRTSLDALVDDRETIHFEGLKLEPLKADSPSSNATSLDEDDLSERIYRFIEAPEESSIPLVIDDQQRKIDEISNIGINFTIKKATVNPAFLNLNHSVKMD